MQFKDYYKIMGLKPEASQDEIKRKYRILARQYHPDKQPHEKKSEAEEKFKDIGEAYEVLKDPQKRAKYDQLLRGGYQSGQEFNVPPGWEFRGARGGERMRPEDMGAFSDFFESLFGGGGLGGFGGFGGFHRGGRTQNIKMRGEDLVSPISISLEDAYHGAARSIGLQLPDGTKTLQVKIPAGVTEGQKIRLRGQGGPGMGGGPNGDLYLEIHIQPHRLFHLHNKDISLGLPITPWEAALGATINVPTLGGKIALKIPADSQNGNKLRLKGRGLPGKPSGDQFVVLQVVLPKPQTEQQKKIYEEMAKEMPFNPRANME